ncbi:Plasma membrane ATPase [Mycena sanguinolenta]|uniref:Plasma membrane ATPase n=1 Tax=Mycena sanguinolenta TaxID=230812 RepID=A0A8H6XZY4_9AGAR|nr:Plasma membrane ATPase [Mycena sanguinolenta]
MLAANTGETLASKHPQRMLTSIYDSRPPPDFPYVRAYAAYSATVQLYARSAPIPPLHQTTKADVVHSGQKLEIEARELCPGDIVILEEGNTIPINAGTKSRTYPQQLSSARPGVSDDDDDNASGPQPVLSVDPSTVMILRRNGGERAKVQGVTLHGHGAPSFSVLVRTNGMWAGGTSEVTSLIARDFTRQRTLALRGASVHPLLGNFAIFASAAHSRCATRAVHPRMLPFATWVDTACRACAQALFNATREQE